MQAQVEKVGQAHTVPYLEAVQDVGGMWVGKVGQASVVPYLEDVQDDVAEGDHDKRDASVQRPGIVALCTSAPHARRSH